MSEHRNHRAILHLDMDAFFAAVEQRDRPELRGKPVIIAGLEKRGVVSTASYEARVFGVRSAMPTARARQLCPDGIYLTPDHRKYAEVSRQVFALLENVSPEIEGLSLDEAFVDITGSLRLLGSPRAIAKRLKAEVKTATELNCSIGLSHNKLLAKLATEMGKPDGLFVIEPHEVHEVLDPIPIGRMWTVGKVAEAKLQSFGLRTIGAVRRAPLSLLQKAIGNHAASLQKLCAGLDDRPVSPHREDLSIGAETTMDTDIRNVDEAEALLMRLCERVGARLRKHAHAARVVTVKLRKPPFETCTRQQTLPFPVDQTLAIYETARNLLQKWWAQEKSPALRLLGVSVSRFERPEVDNSLFQPKKSDVPDELLDRINEKFGTLSIRRAKSIRADQRKE